MKATQFFFNLFFLAVVSFFTGCNLHEDGKETVVKVNPEFTLDLFEELNDSRNFTFRIKTIEPQTCTNNAIDYTSSRTGSLLLLNINEILEAPDCVEGNAPVSANASVGFLPNGTLDVSINLKNTIENKGTLQITNDAFLLSMENEHGFELVHRELRRIPNKLVWGYVAFEDADAAGDWPENFLKDLEDLTGAINLSKGYYGYFDINDDYRAALRTPPPFSYFKTFYRQADGSIDALEMLLENYRTGNAAGLIEVKLFTWDGKIL